MFKEFDLLKAVNVTPNWDSFLARLAEFAAPEPWALPGDTGASKPFLVLSNLVRQSYRRAVAVGALAHGEHDGVPTFAFCPGLRTVGFELIYLVAHRTPPGTGGREWKLDRPRRANEARRLLSFEPKVELPGAPRFWKDPADLVLDPGALRRLDVDCEHLATNDRLIELFPRDLQADDAIVRTLRLQWAIEVAIERGCENPRIAAPVFTFDSPTSGDGQVRLCLPLHLKATTRDNRAADLALVIAPTLRDGELVGYTPKTLLSTASVYLQSRIFEIPSTEVWPRIS